MGSGTRCGAEEKGDREEAMRERWRHWDREGEVCEGDGDQEVDWWSDGAG